MSINHLEPAYTEKAAPFIEELGGKLGGLEFLERTVPQLPAIILPRKIVRPGEEWDETPFEGENIVRASHPHDFQGLVDVVGTEVVPGISASVRQSIESVRMDAASDEVMVYGRYENPAYDGKVVIGVQPKVRNTSGYQRGSVVEHPNQPDRFFINWIDGLSSDFRIDSGLYDQNGKVLERYCYTDSRADASTLVELYKQVRTSGLAKEDHSFQIEFGEDKWGSSLPYLYQVRALVRKELAQFSLPVGAKGSLVFGITDPNGVVLPVFHSYN